MKKGGEHQSAILNFWRLPNMTEFPGNLLLMRKDLANALLLQLGLKTDLGREFRRLKLVNSLILTSR